MTSKKDLETGLVFAPRFDEQGLIPCITTHARTGKVLMFAYMNAESLQKTIDTRQAHYWSRSRGALWHKGATSGMTQHIVEMRTDCDQDCIWIRVEVKGPEASCHTGRESCFYRTVTLEGDAKQTHLRFIDNAMIFDPTAVYKN